MVDRLLYLITLICAFGIVWWLWGKCDYADGWLAKGVRIVRRAALAVVIFCPVFILSGEKFSLGSLALSAGFGLFAYGCAAGAYQWLHGKIFGASVADDAAHRRGAKIADAGSVARSLKGEPSRFSFGGVPVPIALETRSFLLAGSPGTGKSQALTAALDELRSDGARAVVADASGQFLQRYHGEQDIILNPFDQRARDWSPLSEIETISDCSAMAKSLVPDSEGEGKVWSSYAQQFVEGVLEYLFTLGAGATNGELFRIVTTATTEELREILRGSPAVALVGEGNERMFSSVRGSTIDALSAIRHLNPQAGSSAFSIRQHIKNEADGWIFLSYQQQQRPALARLISCQLDVAARAVLELPPDLNRRVIFALDELPLLGKVQSLIELLSNGRKHGSVVFAGLQTIAQLRELYGRETSQTLLANIGSWLTLRVSDAETAEYMSKNLGDEEKLRVTRSGGESQKSMELGGQTKSDNWSEQIVKDRIVMPSELQNMPDLTGYFNLTGPTPTVKITLDLVPPKTVAPAFLAAPPRTRKVEPVAEVEQATAASNPSYFPPGIMDTDEQKSNEFEV